MYQETSKDKWIWNLSILDLEPYIGKQIPIETIKRIFPHARLD